MLKNKKGISSLTVVLIVIIAILVTAVSVYFIMDYTNKNSVKDEQVQSQSATDNTNNAINNNVGNSQEVVEDTSKATNENKMFYEENYGVDYISGYEGIDSSFVTAVKNIVNEKQNSNNLKYISEFNFYKNSKISSSYFKLTDELVSQMDSVYYEQHNSTATTINISTGSKMKNTEIFELYNISNTEVAKAILSDMVSHITRSTLLKSTEGDISAPTVNVSELTNESSGYISTLSSNLDEKVTAYVKDGAVYVDYKDSDVLFVLGLGSHMNIGLQTVTQTVKM